jgi:hypothetical protein
MNLCLCGSEAGYPHDGDCPYPLFRATEAQERAWQYHRDRKRAFLDGVTPQAEG